MKVHQSGIGIFHEGKVNGFLQKNNQLNVISNVCCSSEFNEKNAKKVSFQFVFSNYIGSQTEKNSIFRTRLFSFGNEYFHLSGIFINNIDFQQLLKKETGRQPSEVQSFFYLSCPSVGPSVCHARVKILRNALRLALMTKKQHGHGTVLLEGCLKDSNASLPPERI